MKRLYDLCALQETFNNGGAEYCKKIFFELVNCGEISKFDFLAYKDSVMDEEVDEFIKDNKVRTLTNNNGGINGGISNNEPIVFRCVLKPTPSILKKQRSIDENFNNTTLEIKGRHDPCIVRRARVVVDSLVALALLDLISLNEGKKWMV